MPNLPYSSPAWSTTKQYKPRQKSLPFNFGEDPNRYAQVISRGFEGVSFSPELPTRTLVTNSILRSESFDHAAWTKTALTVGADAVANPNDGLVSADSLLETTANSGHYIEQAVTLIGGPVTISVFAKANGRSWVRPTLVDSAAVTKAGYFDLTTGVVGTASSGVTSKIIPTGITGWYRCEVVVANAAAGAAVLYFEISTDGSTLSYVGDATKGVYLYGAQVEDQRSFADAYVSTTSVARTISAPNTDYRENSTRDSAADPFAFLAVESDPTSMQPESLVRFDRSYARIPAPFYSPASMTFARPPMHDIKSGTNYAVTFDDYRTTNIIPSASRIAVSSVGAVATLEAASAIFGTSLLSVGSTNGSSQVFGTHYAGAGIAALLLTMGITSTVVRTARSISVSVPSTSTAKIKYVDALDTAIQVESNGELGFTISLAQPNALSLKSVRPLTTSGAHSGASGGQLVAWNGDKIVGVTKATAASGSSITIPVEGPFAVEDLAITHIAFATAGTRIAIEPPVTGASARTVQRFYLPGVTTGITNRADIPKFEVQTDPITFLGLVIAYLAAPSEDTYFIAESGAVSRWMGPILVKEVTEIQMQDVVVQVTAGA